MQKLPKAGSLLIKEYLIVYKNKNKNEAFLAQVCSHPSDNIKVNNNFVDIKTFTGVLIKADWEDKPLAGVKYKNGQIVGSFYKSLTNNAKIQSCTPIFYRYQTVNIIPCSGDYGTSYSGGCLEAVFTSYTDTSWLCFDTAYNFYNPYFNYSYGNGGSTNGSYFNTNTYPNNINGYNMCNVATNSGSDRNAFNSQIQKTIDALTLYNSIQGFTLDKADFFAKSLGGSIKEYFPAMERLGKVSAGVGLAVDFIDLVVAIDEGGNQNITNSAILLGLGVAAIWAAPFEIEVFGGLAIYITVISTNKPANCN